MNDTPPTLYEWAGGAKALERLAETFYGRVREDPLLEPVFRDMDREHPKHYDQMMHLLPMSLDENSDEAYTMKLQNMI